MVDKEKIRWDLRRYFAYHGQIDIDDEGRVSCTGNVELTARLNKLPVKFAVVEGSFLAGSRSLKTLEGCPHTVGYNFVMDGNPISNLQDAPTSVGIRVSLIGCLLQDLKGCPPCKQLQIVNNPLESLDGLPENLDLLRLSWQKNLPLLKTLTAKQIVLATDATTSKVVHECQKILNSYAGEGLAGSFACAHELEMAGLKENAAW